MRKLVLLGFLFVQRLFALDFNYSCVSEHLEIACSEKDVQVCDDLLKLSEKMCERLSEEFHHRLKHKIQVFLFPDIQSFHEAIHQKEAPDWLICAFESPIQVVSPLNPGSYHSSENVKKVLLRGIVQTFIYDKFKDNNAPWWLIAGITAKKVDWPYVNTSIALPGIAELETSTYGIPGMGWCALSFTTYIEEKYGWKVVLQLLENYSSLEQVIGLSMEKLVLEWQLSVGNEL